MKKVKKESKPFWVAPSSGIVIDRKYLTEILSVDYENCVDNDGKLSDMYYTELYYVLSDNIREFIDRCISKTTENIDRQRRNSDAHKCDPQYRICWKQSANAEWEYVGYYKYLSDAKAELNTWKTNTGHYYKIVEIVNGVVGTQDLRDPEF